MKQIFLFLNDIILSFFDGVFWNSDRHITIVNLFIFIMRNLLDSQYIQCQRAFQSFIQRPKSNTSYYFLQTEGCAPITVIKIANTDIAKLTNRKAKITNQFNLLCQRFTLFIWFEGLSSSLFRFFLLVTLFEVLCLGGLSILL